VASRWEILKGPMQKSRQGAPDEIVWTWLVAHSGVDSAYIDVAVTGAAFARVLRGSAGVGERLRQAVATQGRSEVDLCLRLGMRPRVIVLDADNGVHFEDESLSVVSPEDVPLL
jgi:hypothetical protein